MFMTKDKQLLNVELARVIEKRRLDQALNAKEFAILAGISYSAARAWFRMPGFPTFCGVVFWQDFVQWRHVQTGLRFGNPNVSQPNPNEDRGGSKPRTNLSARAAQLLAEAG